MTPVFGLRKDDIVLIVLLRAQCHWCPSSVFNNPLLHPAQGRDTTNRWHLFTQHKITLFTIIYKGFYHIWDEESHRPFRLPSGSVRRLHSILGRHTWCVCASLVCGREEETGWACSEDTLWEEGSAACCECLGSSEMEVQSSGSYRGRG